MPKKNWACWLILVVVVVSPAIAETGDPIIWMGCGISRLAFMEAVTEAYTEATGTTFRMAGGGATKGIRLTAIGRSDLGGSCRHQLLEEGGAIHPEEDSVRMIHVGWDALVPIVHTSNPVRDLSQEDLRSIFRGTIRDWKVVGGEPGAIDLLARAGKTSGVGYMFRILVLGDPGANFSENARIFESSGPLEENIEKRFKRGIAITGVSSARKRAVKMLSVDGIEPTKENILSGAYPYFRPLFLVVGKEAGEDVLNFVDFVLSDEAQQVISREGTVNLAEGQGLEAKWTLSDLSDRP